MTLQELIAALTGGRDQRAPSPAPSRQGRLPGIIPGALGMLNVDPPKTLPPLRQDQWQMPMGPGAEPLPRPQLPPLPLEAELKLQGRPLSELQWRGGALDMSNSPTLPPGGPARGMEPLDAPEAPPLPSYIPRPDPELAALLSRDRDSVSRYRLENERELGALRRRAETAAETAARIEQDRARFEQNRWPQGPAWRDGQPDRRFSPRSNRP
jgi:hypothetical protein